MDKTLPAVMVVEIPTFREVISSGETHEDYEKFWAWGKEHRHIFKDIQIDNRKNDWDGINIKLDETALTHGNYCCVEVIGRVMKSGNDTVLLISVKQ
ncbi:MAG: hypothetical protein FWB96_06365 [Defluviitaleaceae bacterium]|nr:hypothetical protein [Defluviitaleaceae bacterium]